jgi:hypothetical protein
LLVPPIRQFDFLNGQYDRLSADATLAHFLDSASPINPQEVLFYPLLARADK